MMVTLYSNSEPQALSNDGRRALKNSSLSLLTSLSSKVNVLEYLTLREAKHIAQKFFRHCHEQTGKYQAKKRRAK